MYRFLITIAAIATALLIILVLFAYQTKHDLEKAGATMPVPQYDPHGRGSVTYFDAVDK